jgi:FAD/FMN-containing dehydrogenase
MAVCYSGNDPDAALAPIRTLGAPVFDLLGEMPYTAVQSYLDDTEPAGMHYHWRTEYLSTLDDRLLDTLCEVFRACPNPMADVGVLHLSGALNERAEDDGAVGNRDAHYVVGVKGMWEPGDPNGSRYRDWVRAGGDRIRPYGTGRTYVNFQTDDESDARVRASYGTNYTRLAALKHRYDPDNLFRSNRNVTPSVARPAAPAGPAR